MKVVVFSRYPADANHPMGGVQSVTVVLVKALAQFNDLEVHVVAFERESKKIMVEHNGRITVHRLPDSSWPQLIDIIIGPGKKRLVDYFKNLNPDILHIHETYGLGLGRIAIPHVFTVHGFDHANLIADSAKYGWIRSELWQFVQRIGFAKQTNIISITPYVREMIEPLTNANMYDIDNPVDERFFKIKRQPERGRILCVGWINERKNTLGSIKAFAKIADNFTDAKLIIAGKHQEVEYFKKVNQSIKQHGIGDRIELLGHIDHIQLEQELAKASVFLLPSKQENSPMAIAEAMAAGIPTIASNRCGMPYMIEEGKTGYLIDPESTDQIADRLLQLIGSPQFSQDMGKNAQELATERFHPHSVAFRTKSVYEHILKTA